MGKLNNPDQTINLTHLHHHPLHLLLHHHHPLTPPPCAACKVPVSGQVYTCPLCNFFLDLKCSQNPQQIKHPFHPTHVLTLLPTPAYPEGSFNCDACAQNGDGFSYHCGICNVDLHVLCASMPLTVSRSFHLHPLSLVFSPPYQNGAFSCDVCRKPGSKAWIYRCGICEFDCHLGCANYSPTATTPTPPAPVSVLVSVQQMRSVVPPIAQTRTVQIQPGSMGIATPLFRPNNSMVPRMAVLPPPPPNFGFGGVGTTAITTTRQNGVMGNAFHGIFDGASQAAGQQLLQNLFGGGGAGGGGGGNMVQGLMGGGGEGANMLQALMGGGDGGANMLQQALMGGGGGGVDGSGLVMDGGGDFAANLFC